MHAKFKSMVKVNTRFIEVQDDHGTYTDWRDYVYIIPNGLKVVQLFVLELFPLVLQLIYGKHSKDDHYKPINRFPELNDFWVYFISHLKYYVQIKHECKDESHERKEQIQN